MNANTVFRTTNIIFLVKGLGMTVYITAIVVIVSLVVGILFALVYLYGHKILRTVVKVYIELFRNTPILLWIMVVRFLIPLPLLVSGIFSMSLVTISGIAEDFRSGISMIPRGQWEAAESQGLSKPQILRLVILPQVMRKLLPILLTEIVTVLKQSSFLWVIGVEELTGRGMILIGRMSDIGQICITYALLAAFYYIINDCVIRLAGKLRQRQKISH